MASISTLNQLPLSIPTALELISELDQCFLIGFANLDHRQIRTLTTWQELFVGTPLSPIFSEACRAIQANEFVERHFAALATARAALQGSLFDTLQQQVRSSLGREELVEIALEEKPGEYPPHLFVWLESIRHWLMEIAIAGYNRLELTTIVPFLQTLEQIQGEPLLMRQAALLTGFCQEMISNLPIVDSGNVPIYRWMDLWTQAMVIALHPTILPPIQMVSGSLEILGLDLRHHSNLVSFTAYGLLNSNSQTQLVRITQSAYKVDVITGPQVWLLFPQALPLLHGYAENQVIELQNVPLLATGDLLWTEQKGSSGKYDLMKRASEFFIEGATQSFVPCRINPSDRHPIQLAEPIFLSKYKIVEQNGQLSLKWDDGSVLPVAKERISSLSELTPEIIAKSHQMFGLLRFNSGTWAIQPLAVAASGKTIFTGQSAAKVCQSPPKSSVVGTLQERASRLLRKG